MECENNTFPKNHNTLSYHLGQKIFFHFPLYSPLLMGFLSVKLILPKPLHFILSNSSLGSFTISDYRFLPPQHLQFYNMKLTIFIPYFRPPVHLALKVQIMNHTLVNFFQFLFYNLLLMAFIRKALCTQNP